MSHLLKDCWGEYDPKRVAIAVALAILVVYLLLILVDERPEGSTVGSLQRVSRASAIRSWASERFDEKPWSPAEHLADMASDVAKERAWRPMEQFELPVAASDVAKERAWRPMEHMGEDNKERPWVRQEGEEASMSPVIPNETKQIMNALGYGDNGTWTEVLTVSELDPSVFTNHQDFVKDVRRFSSGANFTSVTDDNNNWSFTQFVGLRRPQHVDIGASARQQQDIDQSVLKRNADFRWGSNQSDFAIQRALDKTDNYEAKVQNAENFVNW